MTAADLGTLPGHAQREALLATLHGDVHGDARGEEGVGSIFDDLGGLAGGDHQGHVLGGERPVELAHRLKQALLVRQSGGDGVLDFGDCCVQLLAGLFKKVGHGLLLMLNRIRPSPSPFGETGEFYGEVFSSEEPPKC